MDKKNCRKIRRIHSDPLCVKKHRRRTFKRSLIRYDNDMKYAIISDIHSNLEALGRALEEIKKRGVDKIVCLGDVVGYGANPSECLALVKENCSAFVMGNHDQAVDDLSLREHFIDWARSAIEWTSGILKTKDKSFIRTFSPLIIDSKADMTWAHGSVHEPNEFYYIFSGEDAVESFKKMKTSFGFFGHTHVPCLFSEKAKEQSYLPEGIYHLKKGERYLINPGSIGQPRDKNPDLGFALFNSGELTLEIIRLHYDNQKAATKIRKAGLPVYLAERLL